MTITEAEQRITEILAELEKSEGRQVRSIGLDENRRHSAFEIGIRLVRSPWTRFICSISSAWNSTASSDIPRAFASSLLRRLP